MRWALLASDYIRSFEGMVTLALTIISLILILGGITATIREYLKGREDVRFNPEPPAHTAARASLVRAVALLVIGITQALLVIILIYRLVSHVGDLRAYGGALLTAQAGAYLVVTLGTWQARSQIESDTESIESDTESIESDTE